jgi:hypothetical protein
MRAHPRRWRSSKYGRYSSSRRLAAAPASTAIP